ncbi:MAG: T9SS type A sorting domain-containing protein [Bacteroidetes bacterium]|nr:T9SS type A sorting domain-containing protein [Bacteroidota bacterium]
MRIRYSSFFMAALFLSLPLSSAVGQDASLTLSRSADFSTANREFESGDVVYVRVTAPEIDPADVDVNELRISSANIASDAASTWSMSFKNNLDGTYTAAIDSLGNGMWYIRAVIADSKGAGFEGDATFRIGPATDPVELRAEGLITELGDASLVVSERRIFVNNDTEIVDQNGNLLDFSELKIGDRVVVNISVSFSGELIARRIQRRSPNTDIALRGKIQEIRETQLVLLERTVIADSATVVRDEYGQLIRFSQLAVGDLISVKGTLLDDNSILAAVIQRESSHPDEYEFSGAIQELREGSFVLLGRHIGVNDSTEIIGKNGEPIRFADLRVGMLIHVVAFVPETDQYEFMAKRIKVVEDSRIVVEGSIEEIIERTVVVEGIPFRVVEDTKIVTLAGAELTFSDLRVGFRVVVEGTATNTSNQLVALRIVVLRPSVEYRTITGFIERIGELDIVVNNHLIDVSDRTEIIGVNGDVIKFSQLEVGMRVQVRAVVFALADTPALEPVLVAERIQVLPPRETRVVGRIREVSETSIVIASVRAAITPETRILNEAGDPIGIDALEVGALAAMHVVKTSDGVVATRIRLLPRLEDEVGVAGVLEAIEDSSLVILGQSFHVLPNTVSRDVDGTKIAFTDLEIGRPVALRGELLAGGTLVALHVQELRNDVKTIKALGPIESVGTSTLEVIGVHFFVDGSTKIYDLNRNEVSLANLNVGQTVLVNAEGQPNGTRLAKTVQLLDVVVSSGDLAVAGDGTISVLGATYELAADALVISDDNVTVDGGGLQDGMFVEIRGSQVDEGVFTVTKVKILSGQLVGTETADLPTGSGLVLHSNYPNPFSDKTTIEYTVPEERATFETTIEIFDLTGRRVRTLAKGATSTGLHSVTWDARDDAGRAVASGLYFYKVRNGEASEVRTMILVR